MTEMNSNPVMDSQMQGLVQQMVEHTNENLRTTIEGMEKEIEALKRDRDTLTAFIERHKPFYDYAREFEEAEANNRERQVHVRIQETLRNPDLIYALKEIGVSLRDSYGLDSFLPLKNERDLIRKVFTMAAWCVAFDARDIFLANASQGYYNVGTE